VTHSETRLAVDRFLGDMTAALRAPQGQLPDRVFPNADRDIDIRILGSHPGAGDYHGSDVLDKGFHAGQSRMRSRPTNGVYPIEYFGGQDGRMALLARGRGETALGEPYNNSYFFYFEVRDQKITRFIEDVESSTIYQVVHDHHIETAN
jgi:ketosteroid isomerase-like protein